MVILWFSMHSLYIITTFNIIDRNHGGIQFNNRISIYENNVTRLVFEKRASRLENLAALKEFGLHIQSIAIVNGLEAFQPGVNYNGKGFCLWHIDEWPH